MLTKSSEPALVQTPSKKVYYIDNLKVVLTILVVLHHTIITYGAPGGWYYSQKTHLLGAIIPMTIFVAVNQAFFMGFFFFLSAYFISSSLKKKGAIRFTTDRLIRLGVPLIFYSFAFSPILSYLVYYFAQGNHITFAQYLSGFDGWIDFGVLWFVAALLLFTLTYVLIRGIVKPHSIRQVEAPSFTAIVLFALAIGILSFLVRIVFPVGWVLKPVGFQLGHFTQYISMFILGLYAARYSWLDGLNYKTGKKLMWLAVILLLMLPVLFVIQTTTHMPLSWFSGGFHWQALLYAIWEQVIGFSIMVALLAIGRKRWNFTSPLMEKLSRSAFAVYIFHPLVVISLSLAVRNWAADPALKFLLVAPLAVVCSFLLAVLIMLVPGVKRII